MQKILTKSRVLGLTLLAVTVACGVQQTLSSIFETTVRNGADLLDDQNNPWYLDDGTPVRYCVESEAPYRVSAADLQMIKDAIDEWNAFFVKYGIDTAKWGTYSDDDLPSDLPNNVSTRGIARSFQYVSGPCENDAKLLRFVFMALNSRFDIPDNDDPRTFGESAIGWAERNSPYDYQKFRTGGRVYIGVVDGKPLFAKHVLLHELGHIFGMPHDSVWVMDSQMATWIGRYIRRRLDTDDATLRAQGFGSIETPAWPYRIRGNETYEFSWDGHSLFGEHRYIDPFDRSDDQEVDPILQVCDDSKQRIALGVHRESFRDQQTADDDDFHDRDLGPELKLILQCRGGEPQEFPIKRSIPRGDSHEFHQALSIKMFAQFNPWSNVGVFVRLPTDRRIHPNLRLPYEGIAHINGRAAAVSFDIRTGGPVLKFDGPAVRPTDQDSWFWLNLSSFGALVEANRL